MIYVVRYLLIALYTVFWGSLGMAIGLVDRSGEGVVWVGRQWIRWVLASCGIEVRTAGLEEFDPRGPYVMMSNHQSVFDIAAIVTSGIVADFESADSKFLSPGSGRGRPVDRKPAGWLLALDPVSEFPGEFMIHHRLRVDGDPPVGITLLADNQASMTAIDATLDHVIRDMVRPKPVHPADIPSL